MYMVTAFSSRLSLPYRDRGAAVSSAGAVTRPRRSSGRLLGRGDVAEEMLVVGHFGACLSFFAF
jgi:hypothetical protein